MKVIREIYWVAEIDPVSAIGWYYSYILPGPSLEDNSTMEHGPFPTREAALADAEAGRPANWEVTE